MEVSPTMVRRVGASGVICASYTTAGFIVARPIPIEIGNFDRIEAGRGENNIGIACLIAMAAIIVNDIDISDRDPRSVV